VLFCHHYASSLSEHATPCSARGTQVLFVLVPVGCLDGQKIALSIVWERDRSLP
jgi:hypothetical protein